MKRVLVALLFALPVTQATAADTISEALQECAAEANSLKRLVCFDRVAASTNQYEDMAYTPGTSAAPAAVASGTAAGTAVARTAPAITAEEAFGNENKRAEHPNEVDTIYVDLQSKKKGHSGEWKLTFTNGQIWQQIGTEYFKFEDVGQLYIERAAWGSFQLGQEGQNRKIRVKRLK